MVDRVERERVLLCARRAEEVWLRPGGEHEHVTAEGHPVGGRRAARVRVDGGDVAGLHRDRARLHEDASQGPSEIRHAELRCGQLVEERLELVVHVPVDEGDVDVLLGQHVGAADAGEPPADDDHRAHGLRHAASLPAARGSNLTRLG